MRKILALVSLASHAFVPGAIAALSALAMPAHAALLAYDPFDIGVGPSAYVAGDDSTGTNVLGGQNPTIGPTPFYAGGWIQSGGDAQAVRDVGSLAYPLFPQSGGLVTDSLQFSCCSFGRNGREISGGLGSGRTPQTIYQSFLIDFGTQGTDDPTQFGFRGYEMWNGGVGDSFRTVQLFMNHFSGVNELTLQVATASGTESALVNGGGLTLDVLAGVHLVVLAFDFDPFEDDVVRMYLDPTDSIEANWAAAASIAVDASDLFITHHSTISSFTFSGAGHIPGRFDEVRWGDTFADVTPFIPAVPEPSVVWLLLVGLLGIAAARRRRR